MTSSLRLTRQCASTAFAESLDTHQPMRVADMVHQQQTQCHAIKQTKNHGPRPGQQFSLHCQKVKRSRRVQDARAMLRYNNLDNKGSTVHASLTLDVTLAPASEGTRTMEASS